MWLSLAMSSDAALRYYDGPELTPTVLQALQTAGRSVEQLDPDDLAALDEFHALGRPATLALADLAAIVPGERVLDLGAGIGGPSRVLARHYGAEVTALDPTERFCRLNETLCQRSSLDDRVTVVCADGRRLPFADGAFDVVWTQAVLQSVEEKDQLLREIRRVLKPDGRYALLEVVAGPGGPVQFPVPWADGPEQSFLVGATELRAVLEGAGFAERDWHARPEVQAAIQRAVAENPAMAAGLPDVTLALVMPDFAARMAGLAQNVETERIDLVQAVLRAN